MISTPSARFRDATAKLNSLLSNDTLRNAGMAVMVRILAALLGLGLQIYLAGSMALGEYGIYVVLWTWISILCQVGVMGFSDSSLRFIPKYMKRKRSDLMNEFLRTGYKTVLVGSLFISIMATIMLNWVSWLVDPAYFWALMAIVVGMPFLALEGYLIGVTRSLSWYLQSTVPAFIIRPALIIASVFWAQRNGIDVDAYFVLSVAVGITAIIITIQTLYLKHKFKPDPSAQPNSSRQKYWLISSLLLMPAMIADDVFAWVDILLLGLLATPEQASVYFAAQRSLSLAAFVQYAFMLVIARNFSLSLASANHAELQQWISKSTRWTFWLTIPSVLLTLVVGYPLLGLFGPDFLEAYPAMIILGFGYIVRASTGQSTELLIILGKHRINFLISSICILFCFLAMMVLIPSYGVTGAAMAMVVVFALRAITYALVIYFETGYWVFVFKPSLLEEEKAVDRHDHVPQSNQTAV